MSKANNVLPVCNRQSGRNGNCRLQTGSTLGNWSAGLRPGESRSFLLP